MIMISPGIRWDVVEWSRYAYAVSHIIALACFLRVRLWRQWPMLFAYAVVDSILALSYDPESRRWISEVYLRVEPFAVALRFACAVEVLHRIMGGRREWLPLVGGLMLFSAAAPIALWSIQPGSPVQTFVQIRAFAQVYTGIFMFCGAGVLLFLGMLRKGPVLSHTLILLALLVKQAAYSTLYLRGPWSKDGWFAADWVGIAIVSLCWFAWAAIAVAYSRLPQRI